jgi:thymidylate synthase
MNLISGNSVSDTVLQAFNEIYNNGHRQESRNGGCSSIFDTTFEVLNPRSRHLHLEGRKSNMFALIAETFWVLAGDDRVDPYLSFFIPRAPQYSDDGKVWHACFTGDTRVKLLDGRDLDMKNLKLEFDTGIDNYVYSWSNENGWIPGKIESAHITKKTSDLVEVMLDNGEKVRCTPDHRFQLRDGSYKEADQLTNGDSLMPCYVSNSLNEGDGRNSAYAYGDGYATIKDNRDGSWRLVHKLVSGNVDGSGLDAHHLDFNSLNNNPNNFQLLSKAEHKSIHSKRFIKLRAERMNTDFEYREIQNEISRNNIKKSFVSQKIALDNGSEVGLNLRKVRSNNMSALNSSSGQVQEKAWLGKVKRILDMDEGYIKYEELRKGSQAPSIEKINSKYGSMEAAMNRMHELFSNKLNHKVVMVNKIDIGEVDVYDLSIGNEEHNFALSSGVVVHNSYGPRIYRFDQHLDAIRAFKEDGINTRRSYIQISMPDLDSMSAIEARYGIGYKPKDLSCNRELHFYVEAGKFCAKTIQRSGDIIFGTGSINPFEFTFIHELMFNEVKAIYPELEMGPYRWHVTNTHLYDFSEEQAIAAMNIDSNYISAENEQNYTKIISPGADDWRGFFGELVRIYTEAITCSAEDSDSVCGSMTSHLGYTFTVYDVPFENNLLWAYVQLVAHYIASKRGILLPNMIDLSSFSNEFVRSIENSTFRKFGVVV